MVKVSSIQSTKVVISSMSNFRHPQKIKRFHYDELLISIIIPNVMFLVETPKYFRKSITKRTITSLNNFKMFEKHSVNAFYSSGVFFKTELHFV